MEIIVEVGTADQQELIKNEILMFVSSMDSVAFASNLIKIIVPEDFDKAVNLIQNTDDYLSVRGVGKGKFITGGKIIEIENGIIMILPPYLYTELYDDVIRGFIIIHELAHVLSKNIFPRIITPLFAKNFYFTNLYILYDEYFANRFSYKVIDNVYPEKSERWNFFYKSHAEGFLEKLLDQAYYETLTGYIWQFRTRVIKDVDSFLEIASHSINELAISTMHLFSALHDVGGILDISALDGSKFINEKTFALVEYLRKKYEAPDHDLTDGYELISDYLTIFGIKVEDIPGGGYIHVLDI